MKFIKALIVLLILAVAYSLYAYFFRAGSVQSVYQDISFNKVWKKNCKSTVVLINNAPISHYAQRKTWQRTKNEVMRKWNPINEECDTLLYINNKKERAYDSGDNNYWAGDFQYCLNGAFGDDKCISKEELLFSVRMWDLGNGEATGKVNGKLIYLDFID